MAHVRPLARHELADFEPALAATEQMMGFVPGSLLTMGHKPDVLAAFLPLVATVLAPGEIDVGLKQLVAHVTSNASGCRYCQAHTASTAVRRGVDEAKIEAVWEFETDDRFSDADRAALRLARDAGAVPNATTSAHFDDLGAHFTETQIVELVSVIAMFGWLNRWNDTMATDLEDEALTFGQQHLAAAGWSPGKHAD